MEQFRVPCLLQPQTSTLHELPLFYVEQAVGASMAATLKQNQNISAKVLVR